ncbi:MAG: CBS domain-containing protein [Candidatus Omnitrophica bacterium]|nr:CBS domain-containing protein [Candidatus Omnitrophota bacterium]
MKVNDCMTKEVVTVRRGTPLREIIRTFKEKNFHTLPVIETDNRLVGLIDFSDILKVFEPYGSEVQQMLKTIPFIDAPQDQNLLETDISAEMGILVVADDIMSSKLVTISPDEDLNRAYSEMKVHNTERLFVTEGGKLIGIICLFDIILSLFKESGVI